MARGFSGVRTSTLSEIADNLREIKDGQATQRYFHTKAGDLAFEGCIFGGSFLAPCPARGMESPDRHGRGPALPVKDAG